MDSNIEILPAETAVQIGMQTTRDQLKPTASTLLDLPYDAMIEKATKIAKVLRTLILQHDMAVSLNKQKPEAKYIKIEGWNTLGAFLNVKPIEKEVREIKPGVWCASVDIVSRTSGEILSNNSAICSKQESAKGYMTDNQLRSLAITRATGKAYRTAFSWIAALADFEPTPAEEMEATIQEQIIEAKHEKNKIQKNAESKNSSPTDTNSKDAPKKPAYDKDNEKQRIALTGILEKRQIADSYWQEISNAMHGKTFSDLEEIIKTTVNHG